MTPDEHDPDRHGDRGMPVGMPDAGALPVMGDTTKLIADARHLVDHPDIVQGSGDFYAAALRGAVRKLADALEAAKLDSDRLDWLEQIQADGIEEELTVAALIIKWRWDGKRYADGLRAAIDAARKAQRPEPPPIEDDYMGWDGIK